MNEFLNECVNESFTVFQERQITKKYQNCLYG